MKKIIILIIAIAFSFASCKEKTDYEKDFRFAPIEDGKALAIIRYTGEKQFIDIPAKMRGMPVTEIGESVFNGKDLLTVNIPKSITKIGDRAFTNNHLTKIDIPNSVITIGASAFENNKLNSISIGKNVTAIGDRAFMYNNLTTISISNAVISIGPMSFKENNIASFTISENHPEYIIKDFFILNKDATQLISYIGSEENIIIPDGVNVIKESAVSRNNIRSVVIPNGVAIIEPAAFYANRLTAAIIPNSVRKIGENAFAGNEIESITIGANVDVESGAFNWYFVNQYSSEEEFDRAAGTYYIASNGSWTKRE